MNITKENKEAFLTRLTARAKRDKGPNATRYYNPIENEIIQADTVELPNDKGFHYLLTCIDLHSKKVDAQPLRNKTSAAVLNAFKKIFERGILKIPKRLEVDNGTEFKGVVAKFFQEKGTYIKRNKPGRHRQTALVERFNQTIGHRIFKTQLDKELQSGKNSRLWLHFYRGIIDNINNKAQPSKMKYKDPVCKGLSCEILPRGTKVLVMLEEPRDIEGNRLPGRFRKTDIKYNLKLREIKEVLIKSNNPPLYLLDGSHGTLKVEPIAYTRNQLLILKPVEIEIVKGLAINK